MQIRQRNVVENQQQSSSRAKRREGGLLRNCYYGMWGRNVLIENAPERLLHPAFNKLYIKSVENQTDKFFVKAPLI